MLLLLIPLFVISLLSLISGAIWLLAGSGRTDGQERREVGEAPNIELSSAAEDFPSSEPAAPNTNDDTSASKVSYSFADIKNEMRDGRWDVAAPLLMTVGGFLGILLFGSLVLLVVIDDKILGSLITATAAITVVRVTIAMIRA